MSSKSEYIKGAPIHFLQEGGRITETPEHEPIIPVIMISVIPADPANHLKQLPGSKRLTVMALIDTGADNVFIDEDFAEENGFIASGVRTVSSASATTEQKVYSALFELPESSSHWIQAADFISSPLRRNGRKYDVVLGMQLLSNGALVLDFPSNVFRFEFTTKPDK